MTPTTKRKSSWLLDTERLTLRPLRIDDVEWIVPLANDLEVAQSVGTMPHPYGRSDGLDFIRLTTKGWAAGVKRDFAVIGEMPMGVVGLMNIDGVGAELGYWLGRRFWHRGFATEAAAALVRLAFRKLELAQLTSGHFVGNQRSARVLAKCGFSPTGEVEKMACVARGTTLDCRRMRLAAADWETTQRLAS